MGLYLPVLWINIHPISENLKLFVAYSV